MGESGILILAFSLLAGAGCLVASDAGVLAVLPVALLYFELRRRDGPAWDTPTKRSRRALAVLALAVLLVFSFPTGAPMILITLVGGWVWFVMRTAPRVSVDEASIALGAACLMLFAVGVHVFGTKSWSRPAIDERPARVWRPRWTFAIVAGVGLLFASGLAAVGLMQSAQSVWALRTEGLR